MGHATRLIRSPTPEKWGNQKAGTWPITSLVIILRRGQGFGEMPEREKKNMCFFFFFDLFLFSPGGGGGWVGTGLRFARLASQPAKKKK